MSEINSSKENCSVENLGQGKNAELKSVSASELIQMSNNIEPLTDEELNAIVDNVKEMDSLDCRSECRYNTGDSYKYANYGFSG